jgi:hypothetical protein
MTWTILIMIAVTVIMTNTDVEEEDEDGDKAGEFIMQMRNKNDGDAVWNDSAEKIEDVYDAVRRRMLTMRW